MVKNKRMDCDIAHPRRETQHRFHVPFVFPSLFLFFTICVLSCSGDVEHLANAVNESDSVPFMHSRGINTLISDSGVMRYHLVAEEWDIYTPEGQASTWKFKKGLLMERFDKNFHIDLYVQADTAYLHQQQTWELRGRVTIRNIKDDRFLTEELFWDMNSHEMWSHKFMRIITPERELQGTEFRSNEEMTKYSVTNSAGKFPVSDTESGTGVEDTISVSSTGNENAPAEQVQNADTTAAQAKVPTVSRTAPSVEKMNKPKMLQP